MQTKNIPDFLMSVNGLDIFFLMIIHSPLKKIHT